ncbi:Hint domain-containing protein [Jannaschia sp. S6380]|uniref:Hint domain-containing protein n=1 Tax=Jannaschia sp. S6380 TaxID=2926408 RepID=UPI001FF4EE05|nr:Hint domain-containing protein [Jannaschia sp. S6380]MCK0167444.1 Hint domain-containing protein [Jannaschia sp. S6380]
MHDVHALDGPVSQPPPPVESGGATQGAARSGPAAAPILVASGALVCTPEGTVRVDDLRSGDAVLTLDGSVTLRRDAVPTWSPPWWQADWIRLEAGAFGNLRPIGLRADHRIAVTGPLVEVATGRDVAMVPVGTMSAARWPGVRPARARGRLIALHPQLRNDPAIRVEGLWLATPRATRNDGPSSGARRDGAPHATLTDGEAADLLRRALAGMGGVAPPCLAGVPRSARAH